MIIDTIYALSTVLGKSGVAVVRVSGADARRVLDDFGVKRSIVSGQFIFSKLYHPISKVHLDDAVILYFQAPNSFSGEDTVEFHLHGSVAVVKDVLSALGCCKYLRVALPGEFSKKAFLNGKLDLTKADALVNLINAETTIQRDIALRQLGGQLENLYELWRKRIISMLARLEALIDFPEEDIPISILEEVADYVLGIMEQIKQHLDTSMRGEIITRGIKVAIIGIPNVGKSSLLNMLARKNVAIVSNIAGTTRDVIEVKVDLRGFPVIFYDTAGVREASDEIESEGVRRALKLSSESDINIYVLDVTDPSSYSILPEASMKPYIIVGNKMDLVKNYHHINNMIKLSTITGEGMDLLLSKLGEIIEGIYSPSHEPLLTSERYKAHLKECLRFLEGAKKGGELEVVTEYVRLAACELGCIMGKIEVEEVLDEIFSSFCIGK